MDEEFENAVQEIKSKTGSNERDRLYELTGLFVLFGGVVLTLISYCIAGSQNSGNAQIDNLEHKVLLFSCFMKNKIKSFAKE